MFVHDKIRDFDFIKICRDCRVPVGLLVVGRDDGGGVMGGWGLVE